MKDNINIEKLFSDKLANHESVVSDQVWAGIQSQIGVGASAAAVSKGISMTSKWIIGVSSVVAVTAVAVVMNFTEAKSESKSPNQISKDSTEIIAENNEIIAENTNQEDKIETSSQSLIEKNRSTENFNQDLNTESTQNFNQEETVLNNSTLHSPEKLIVKQAVPSIEIANEKPVQVKKEAKEVKEVAKTNSETSTSNNNLKGAVVEWKKTNVFSPNNDGVNDLFFLESKELKEFSITIINEKNSVVFISDDPKFKWDGTDYKTGEMVPVGSYGYIVFAVDIYNNPIKIFNSLNISR